MGGFNKTIFDPTNPCFDCQQRRAGCHSTDPQSENYCERYAKWKLDRNKKSANISAQRNAERGIYERHN